MAKYYIIILQNTIHCKLKWKMPPAEGTAYQNVNIKRTVDAIK